MAETTCIRLNLFSILIYKPKISRIEEKNKKIPTIVLCCAGKVVCYTILAELKKFMQNIQGQNMYKKKTVKQ